MAIVTITGLDEWLIALNTTEKQTEKILRRSIYPGADIVANICRQEIEALPVDNTLIAWKPYRQGPTAKQKRSLLKKGAMGLALMKHRNDGWDTKLGFDGYSEVQENRSYVNGVKVTNYNSNNNPGHYVPNAVIARTINNGASNMKAHPFMYRTISRSRANAERAMGEQFIDEIMILLGK